MRGLRAGSKKDLRPAPKRKWKSRPDKDAANPKRIGMDEKPKGKNKTQDERLAEGNRG